jgi:hypothetical protein
MQRIILIAITTGIAIRNGLVRGIHDLAAAIGRLLIGDVEPLSQRWLIM